MADIGKIKPSERKVEIKNPGTGKKEGITVGILSIDDEQMKRIKRKITDRRIDLEKKGKAFKANELEDNRNAIIFEGMTGWEWTEDEDGEPALFNGKVPEFNRANVYEVFEAAPWFAEQLKEEMSDTESFFKK